MMRGGMRALLAMEDDLLPAAEAGTGAEALRLACELELDLILLDMNMPGMDGLETIRQLRAAGVEARIVIFSVSDDHANVLAALREGADGYLLKDMEPEELISQIRLAALGKLALSPELTRVLAEAIRERPKPGHGVPMVSLTKRERDVLRLIAKGQTNKMIARKLDISEGTVKVHVKNLLHKLGLRSRVEAAVWVLEHERIRS
ncbi:two-component system response regulator NarL [Stutzerimonas nitrititolerans]|uniref:two-component system response regulator NarL n=1 Tax=Stutzerimonas nitrititolerans TaxID=2482751 RepID=UPI0028ABC9CF|nr:two-component system response regulator NarL [Stutzerimonas nitrititolerans]